METTIDPKKHTLLIVDDEPDLRDILALQFQRNGFKVLKASNGSEAFEIVKTQNIDLVISDIRMPGGNGVELLENVRKHHYEVPVVLFITGFADISVEDAFDKGAEAVFAKPFNQKVLLAAVIRALTPKDTRWARKDWRGDTALPLRISYSGLKEAQEAKVLNIGRGGIFAGLEKVPPVNEIVGFKIEFTEGAILSIEGEGIVRWTRTVKGSLPTGCGIEFTGLSDVTKTKVIELINFLKTKQYIPKS